MFKGKLLFFLFFIFLSGIAYSYDYRLPINSEYYLNVNLDKNIGGNTYDKVQKQVNSQYKGKLNKNNTIAEFNLYEYGYYMNLGISANFTTNETVKNKKLGNIKTDYDNKVLGIAGLGIFWYNGLRMEVEYSQDNKKENKDNFKANLSKYVFNIIREHYTYDAKLTPYIGLGAGAIEAKVNYKKDYKPIVQGILGASYKLGKYTSLYAQYKLTTTITDLKVDNYKFGYLNNSVDFGFRIFLF